MLPETHCSLRTTRREEGFQDRRYFFNIVFQESTTIGNYSDVKRYLTLTLISNYNELCVLGHGMKNKDERFLKSYSFQNKTQIKWIDKKLRFNTLMLSLRSDSQILSIIYVPCMLDTLETITYRIILLLVKKTCCQNGRHYRIDLLLINK